MFLDNARVCDPVQRTDIAGIGFTRSYYIYIYIYIIIVCFTVHIATDAVPGEFTAPEMPLAAGHTAEDLRKVRTGNGRGHL